MKIAIYSRKSIFTGKGESIENQIDLCRDYCETHIKDKNLEYIIYEDEGFSGKNINRPKFQELLTDIKSKKIDVLICYRLDRISRNVADFSSTLELLQSNGCDFISIKEQFDTSSPMGRAMIYIASVFAQLERETIAERVKDNMLQMAKMGKWSGGQLPLGYTSEKLTYMTEELKEKSFVKLVPIDKELNIVKFIYNNYLAKGSILNVVKELNDSGYKSKTGVNFELTGVKRILKNPLYVRSNERTSEYLESKGYNVFGTPNGNGYLSYNKKTSKIKNDNSEWIIAVSSHKGIISSSDWLKVQKAFDNNREKAKEFSNRTGTGSNDSLFAGILKCGKCGSNMVIKYNTKNKKTGESYIYYVCSNKERKYGTNKCDCPSLRTDIIDEKIISKIKSYNKDTILEIYNERLKDLTNTSDKKILSNLKSEINKKELQAHNLIMQLSNAPNKEVSDMIMNEVTKISDEINLLKQNIKNSETKNEYIKENIYSIKNLIDSFLKFNNYIDTSDDINIKRALIRNIIEKVVYNIQDKNFEVNFFSINNMQLDSASKSTHMLTTYEISLYEHGKTIGEKLKYYRLKYNLTQNQLAEIIGFSNGSCIKDIELNRKLPGREISEKLASYFDLNTKYFFDTYLESTDNIAHKLKNYRATHSITIAQVCNKLNIKNTSWIRWESGHNYISRDKYEILKKHKIL